MEATRRPRLREALERLAEATDSILASNYSVNGVGIPMDLNEGDHYTKNTADELLIITYRHEGKVYSVQIRRK